MCDHIECHGNGLRIVRTEVALHHPPNCTPEEGWVQEDDGWWVEDTGHWWVVEFRKGGFLASYHKDWQDALAWAWKFLELELGHGSS